MADEFRNKATIRVVDVLWSCLIITPLTIFYWGGTWKLLDLYLFPQDNLSSYYVSLAIGTTGCLGGYLFLPLLDTCIPTERICNFKHILTSRVAIYILAFLVLNYWRGLWNLMDHFIGSDPVINGVCVAVPSVILISLRALGNIVAAPFSVELDVSVNIYKPFTRFKTHPSRFWLYLCDSVFSHIFICGLSVMIWRSLWHLMDAGILPHDRILSYYVSLGTGFGSALVLFILQSPISVLGHHLLQVHWSLMYILQVLLRIVEAVVTLLIWRGGWGLNRDYLLDSTLDAAVAHSLGSVGLLLLQALATVSTLNIVVDTQTPDVNNFFYHVNYFKYFIERRDQNDLQIQGSERSSSVDRGLLEDSDDDIIGPNTYA